MKNSRRIICEIGDHSKGFTLLEVLISVLILAIGFLGFAALQMASVNNNLEAGFRSQATIIAQDLASRIHINRDYTNWDGRADTKKASGAVTAEGALGDLNLYFTSGAAALRDGHTCANAALPDQFHSSDPALLCRALGPAVPGSPTARNGCDPQEMAAFDVWEVCRSAQNILPDGRVHVACSPKADITFALGATTVQTNPRNNPYDETHRYFDPTPDVLEGADPTNDVCGPGSMYSIYVSWRRADTRTDTGESDLIGNNANYRCQNDLGVGSERDCVAVDLVP